MRIVILGSQNSWHVQQLSRAASRQGHEISLISFSSLRAEIDRRRNHRPDDRVHGFGDVLVVRCMPRGTLEQIIFRMDVLLNAAQDGQQIVNHPRTLEIAIDKYLGLSRLQRAGLLVPRTITCQQLDDARRACRQLGGDVVIKPLFGSQGRGIARLTHAEQTQRELQQCFETCGVFYLQEFIRHPGYDYRLFVIGNDVIGMQRHNADDWRLNVRLGAKVQPCEVTHELREIAIRSARAVNAEIAAVDVLADMQGQLYVLEVNACPGWQALQSVCTMNIADRICDYLQRSAAARETERQPDEPPETTGASPYTHPLDR